MQVSLLHSCINFTNWKLGCRRLEYLSGNHTGQEAQREDLPNFMALCESMAQCCCTCQLATLGGSFLMVDACLGRITHQLAFPWGTRHLISPELAGNIVMILLFFF